MDFKAMEATFVPAGSSEPKAGAKASITSGSEWSGYQVRDAMWLVVFLYYEVHSVSSGPRTI